MGQKANPNMLRMGITRSWDSKWFAGGKKFVKLLHQDLEIRKFLNKKLVEAVIGKIEILRSTNQIGINIHTAKPGNVIGIQGQMVEELKKELEKMTGEKIQVNIKEIKRPGLVARIVAESIAKQIEKRVSHRRAAKMAMDKIMESGAMGVKIFAGGRLNGVEIARSEYFSKGKVPLQTLRADIDYASCPAFTAYGAIGIKVWIYRGLVFKKKGETMSTEAQM
ncbi:MAG: 30S ribosomal protein S3 [Patescibacteria group bacterium]